MKITTKILSTGLKASLIAASIGSLMLFPSVPSHADDTQLFTQPPGGVQSAPNVMFYIDNTANWVRNNSNFPDGMTPGQAEFKAMFSAVESVVQSGNRINVGIAMHSASTSASTNSTNTKEAAYIRMGARDMSVQANLDAFREMERQFRAINNFNAAGEGGGQTATPARGMYELWRYFSSLRPGHFPMQSGDPAQKGDWQGNNQARSTSRLGAFSLNSGFAYPDNSGIGAYRSPISGTDPCARNFIIYIANNTGAMNNSSLGRVGDQVYDGFPLAADRTPKINIPGEAGASNDWMDEWAKFMYSKGANNVAADVNGKIVTYVVDVVAGDGSSINPYSKLLQSAARNGGGRYFRITGDNYSELEKALKEIFNEIQAVNSVFASVALPVSVNVRGTNLNQVYLGMFRPDRTAAPNWPGNVKQYQLTLDVNGRLALSDRNGQQALNQSTGFFTRNAVSYWTSQNSYWSFDPDTGVLDDAGTPINEQISDAPDGPIVERGGVNQRLRLDFTGSASKAASSRKVLTYVGNPSTAVALEDSGSTQFKVGNSLITNNALRPTASSPAISNAERDQIINWIRGADLNDENGDGLFTDVRPRAHGDVIHSRPAVINYNRFPADPLTGRPNDNDVVIFYGANDGLLRAVQGGQADLNGDTGFDGGEELWSFAAEEFFPKFKRMKDNSAKISWNASTPGEPKPYFFDGPIGVYRHDAPNTGTGSTLTQGDGKIVSGSCDARDPSDCDQVVIYVPMRRGGRYIYAFDVTDPEAPKLLWKIGNTKAGFEELGQTWSTPNVVSVLIQDGTGSIPKDANNRDKATPVLVFGGGYDPGVDDKDPVSGTRAMGRAVYFVNALTGIPVKVFKGSTSAAYGGPGNSGMTEAQRLGAEQMICSIPSDVSVLTRDPRSGFNLPAFRAYVGDTCGQVWRIDTADSNPDNWVITRLANVGNNSSVHGSAVPSPANPYSHDRKFLFPPDVVYGGRDGRGEFDYILIGSGDREHPFNGYGTVDYPDSQAVTNRFYMFKDYNVNAGSGPDPLDPSKTVTKIYSYRDGQTQPVAPSNISFTPSSGGTIDIPGSLPYTENQLYDATANQIQISSASANQRDDAELALGIDNPPGSNGFYGWYITLEKGEKVVGGSTTVAGSVFFGTNVPTPSTASCNNNLGEARLYQVNIKTGAAVPPNPLTPVDSISARYQVIPGGGFPPTPVPVSVVINGKLQEGVIAGTAVVQPQESAIETRLRIYNRKVIDR